MRSLDFFLVFDRLRRQLAGDLDGRSPLHPEAGSRRGGNWAVERGPGGAGRKTSTQPSPLCAVAERSSLRVAFAPNTPPPLAMYPGYGEIWHDELLKLSVAPIAVAIAAAALPVSVAAPIAVAVAVVVAAAAAVVVVVAAAAVVVVVVVVAADVAAAEVDAL